MASTSGVKAHWGYRSLTVQGDAAHSLAVNTGNGNLVVTATDFTFPARIPAVFMRTYNHADAGISPSAHSMLGRGWRFAFEESVTILGGTSNAFYLDTTGAEFTWIWNGTSYDRPTGVFSDLHVDIPDSEIVITMPNGFLRVFDLASGLLKRYVDHNGNVLRFQRNMALQLVSIDIGDGTNFTSLVDTFIYIAGRLVNFGLSTEAGLSWALSYDPSSDLLLSVTDPMGQTWAYTYDATTHGLLSITDPVGYTTTPSYSTGILYDGSGRVWKLIDQAATTSAIEFSYAGATTTVTDRRGFATIMQHGTVYKELLTVQLPLPSGHNTTTYAWSPNLTLTSVTDAEGHATAYTYDGNGNLTTVTNAALKTTTLTYNPNNTLSSVTTPLGLTTSFLYDLSTGRNLTQITRPMGQFIEFEYNALGDLTKSIDPLGQTIEHTYESVYGYRASSSNVLDPQGSAPRRLTTTYEYSTSGIYFLGSFNPCGVTTKVSPDLLGRAENAGILLNGGPAGIISEYTYDQCGNLTSIKDPVGNITTYSYDQLSQLVSVLSPETSTAQSSGFGYDAEGNLTSSTRWLSALSSVTTSYAYDPVSRLVSLTLPAAPSTPSSPSTYSFAYDGVGNVLSRQDPIGSAVAFTYTVLNQCETESGPVPGLKFAYAYDDDGRLIQLTGQPGDLPVGYTSRNYLYTYDGNGRLIAVETPVVGSARLKTEYAYYANDQLASVRLPKQVAAGGPPSRAFAYDTVGRLNSVTDAQGHSVSYTYRDDGLLSMKTDAEARRTTYSYDTAGRLVRVDQPLGAYTEYALDLNGNVLVLTGPEGFVTTYAYDGRDRLTMMTRTDSTPTPHISYPTAYTYDQLDRLTSSIDPRRKKTVYEYDAQSRLVQVNEDVNYTAPAPPVTDGFNYQFGYSYDPKGRLVKRTNPDSGFMVYAYDEADRLVSTTDEAGGVTSLTYDLWGALTKRTWADNVRELYASDEVDRTVSQTNHIGEQVAFSYDRNGNNIKTISPFGLESTFGYNDRDELISVSSVPSTGGTPVIETFSYTPNGRLWTYNGPAQEGWTFEYDALGRWTRAYTNLGKASTRSYNANNTLAATTDFNNLRFSMAYNSMRLRTATTAESAPTPNQTSYEWEYIDLKKVTEPDGSVRSFTRDRLGRIVETTRSLGGPGATTTYTYNWRGQVTQRTFGGGAGSETFTYDLRGLLTAVNYTNPTAAITMEYDIRGRQTAVHFPGGVERRFLYDRLGRLVGDFITDSAGNKLVTYYSYDKAGNRVVDIVDQKLPISSTLPAAIPTDNFGNPVIVSGSTTPQPPIPNYDVTTYPAYSKDYSSLTVEHRVRTGGTGPYQYLIAYPPGSPGSPVSNPIELNISGGFPPTSEIKILDPFGDYLYVLDGVSTLAPAALGSSPNLMKHKMQRDAQGAVATETTQELAVSTPTTDDSDLGATCCGKNSVSSDGVRAVENKAGRMGVAQSMELNKSLLSGAAGSVNKVGPPFSEIMDPSGPSQQQITIAYWSDYEKKFQQEIAGLLEEIKVKRNLYSGRAEGITKSSGGGPEAALAGFKHDSFGQLRQSTDFGATPPVVKDFEHDWVSGQCQSLHDSASGLDTLFNHGPGWTRNCRMDVPPEWRGTWMLRGPEGQVKLVLDADGEASTAYQYGSTGNRFGMQAIGTPMPAPPPYFDQDLAPVESFPNYTDGGGMARENTPMIGPLDLQAPSGAGGMGASGNPDLAGNAGADNGGWSIGGGGYWTGPARPGDFSESFPAYPPSEWHKPGSPGDMAPPQAPPVSGGPSGQASGGGAPGGGMSGADSRLGGMEGRGGAWGAQDYYGPKPGQQTGSSYIDDQRNYRAPQPGYPPIGGGRPGIYHGGQWIDPTPRPMPAYPQPRAPIAAPDYGPSPGLPNSESKHSEASGVAAQDAAKQAADADGNDEKKKTRKKQKGATGASQDQEKSEEDNRDNKNDTDVAPSVIDQVWKRNSDAEDVLEEIDEPDGGRIGDPTGYKQHMVRKHTRNAVTDDVDYTSELYNEPATQIIIGAVIPGPEDLIIDAAAAYKQCKTLKVAAAVHVTRYARGTGRLFKSAGALEKYVNKKVGKHFNNTLNSFECVYAGGASAGYDQAVTAGLSWLGPNIRSTGHPGIYRSQEFKSDGRTFFKQFRAPAYKQKRGPVQANFEVYEVMGHTAHQRVDYHVDIVK